MKLVVGGAWQGKTNAACLYFKIKEEELADGRNCDLNIIYSAVVRLLQGQIWY